MLFNSECVFNIREINANNPARIKSLILSSRRISALQWDANNNNNISFPSGLLYFYFNNLVISRDF